ncbi:MAG: NAD(P)H-quinone oxidoreductase [Polaromonas sp.]|uniref:NAD(P)H-quinone oxidoreductase n=1 Tax=Polaromonas sp. TaxID=1869339 RepID=UPI0025E0E24C|nr:NAD(P)H-quinone oxidoreductase [Polaromonas sp.]MBI2726320.1 NAD(P)H-quinone oxidoreductase [Polaromonas sp.]
MLAIELAWHGDGASLEVAERPIPVAGKAEVVIRVLAAGINRADLSQRKKGYTLPRDASDIPGLEVCGTIVSGDVEGSGFAIGQRVCALLEGGGYAEYALARLGQCLPVPSCLSDAQAAALPETYFTVWSNVFERANLQPGEVLLVHGGASGVGTAAIQICTALGHQVIATVGSEVKVSAVEALGVVRAINHSRENFSEITLSVTQGRGANVILDMVGGEYLERNILCLADDGRLVMIAMMGGMSANLDLEQVIRRRLVITGSTLRPRTLAFKTSVRNALHARVWPLLETGLIVPLVHATFPFRSATDAQAMLARSEHIGKIILTF